MVVSLGVTSLAKGLKEFTLALRELHLSHKTLRDIKKDAFAVDSIHMQNMSCPQTSFYIFSTITEIHNYFFFKLGFMLHSMATR